MIIFFSLLGLVVLGYLFGNISNARIVSKIINKDITKLGSGNPGTMNVTRNFGVKLGLLTFLLDILKTVIPCLVAFLIATYVIGNYVNIFVYLTGLSVVIGHIFPIFFKFKGGKGVASTIGIYLVLFPFHTVAALILGLIVLLTFKIGSLTSFCVIIGLTVIGIIYAGNYIENILMVVLLVLILLMHHENIKKLLKGEERKVNLFKNKEDKTIIEDDINKTDNIKEDENK